MVYVGAIPQDLDFLEPQRNAMLGLGKLAEAVLGTQTVIDGLTVLPASPPALSVRVAPGQIYATAALDSLAFGSMAADPGHQIVKQGVLLDGQIIPINPPGTAGYSQWFLIQAAFQESETGAQVLPYYNSANPTQAWAGPNNSGTQQFTRRNGVVTLQVKAGVPAPTGSHEQPQPDPGWAGLAWVSVAAGATTIQAANIATFTSYNNIPIKLPQLVKAVGASVTLVTAAPRQLRADEAGLVLVDTTNIANGGEIRLPPAGAIPGVPLRFRFAAREITPHVRRDIPWCKVKPGTASDIFDLDYAVLVTGDSLEMVSDGVSRWIWSAGFATLSYQTQIVAGTSIPHNVTTMLPWVQQTNTAPSQWYTAGSPTRIRVPVSGRYLVDTRVSFNAAQAGATPTARTRAFSLYLNGSVYSPMSNEGVDLNDGHVVSSQSSSVFAYAGDYFELGVTQTSGAALTLSNDTYIRVSADMG